MSVFANGSGRALRLARRFAAALGAAAGALTVLASGAAGQLASEVPPRQTEITVSASEFMALTLAREGPEAALSVYETLTPDARRDPGVVLAAATALQRLDRPGEAEALLRGAIARRPGEARLRLEYARLLYERNRDVSAGFQFQLALGARDLQLLERAAAARYLAEIDDRRPWRFAANIALAPDSNINQATSSDTVNLFGLPFTLDETARATSGVGIEAGGSAERRFKLGRTRLVLSTGVRRREYKGARFDDTLAVGGAALEAGKYIVSANLARRWVGGTRQLDVYGVSLAREVRLTDRLGLSLQTSLREIDQRSGDFRDGLLYGLGASVRRALPSAGFVEGGIDVRRFEAESASQSYWLAGLVATGYRDLPGGFGLLAEPAVSYREHDAGDFFFPKPREDVAASLRLRVVKRDRAVLGAFPYAEIAGERTWSNQVLYETERVYGRFGLTRTF